MQRGPCSGMAFRFLTGDMKDASRCNDGQRRGGCGFRRIRGGAVLGRSAIQFVRGQAGDVGPEAPEFLIKTTMVAAGWRQPVIRGSVFQVVARWQQRVRPSEPWTDCQA